MASVECLQEVLRPLVAERQALRERCAGWGALESNRLEVGRRQRELSDALVSHPDSIGIRMGTFDGDSGIRPGCVISWPPGCKRSASTCFRRDATEFRINGFTDACGAFGTDANEENGRLVALASSKHKECLPDAVLTAISEVLQVARRDCVGMRRSRTRMGGFACSGVAGRLC
jgi:hypothetical protein